MLSGLNLLYLYSIFRASEVIIVRTTNIQLKLGNNGRMSRAVTNIVRQIETWQIVPSSGCPYHRKVDGNQSENLLCSRGYVMPRTFFFFFFTVR